MKAKQLALGIALALASGPVGAGDSESAFRGRRIAEANCADCHAIAQFDMSANPKAPAFRDIGKLRPLEALRRDLRGALFLRHAVMPDFEPDATQADDLVTYLRWCRRFPSAAR